MGPGSVEAARVAIAVRMQDPAGQKYLAFHQAMLSGRGPANKDIALAAAKDAGLDIAQIEKDIDSAEVKETLDESAKLARELTLNGTPSYVVGKDVMIGAVGMAALNRKDQSGARAVTPRPRSLCQRSLKACARPGAFILMNSASRAPLRVTMARRAITTHMFQISIKGCR